jgi:universal stress protein E
MIPARNSITMTGLTKGRVAMAQRLQRILVAIRDVRHAPRNELRKAAALARASRAAIELFHAIDEPDPAASWPETATAQTAARQRAAIAARRRQRLEQFARDALLRGITVSCTTNWDHPPHEAIARRALASRSDLVVAATHGHRLGARLVLRNTDWELIRHCPLPLLLVKSRRPYQRPVVLAAVDPFHAHARPAGLDGRLLEAGARLAQLLRGTLHIFHSYLPLTSVAAVSVGAAPLVVMPPEVEDAHERQIERTIGALAQRAGIPPARRHVCLGDVASELTATARRARAGVVVMGAVSRSAVARLFIGNAAERVLDRIGCDVLIVKPRGFRSGIARASGAAPGPRSPRGARSPQRPRRARSVRAADVVLPPLL